MPQQMKQAKRRILEGRKAEYAIISGLVADQVATVVSPEYAGLFSALAFLLTGGAS